MTQAGSGPGGGNTDTPTDAFAVPFGPVQARLNWVVLVRAPVDSLPEVAFAPDQPPEAVQDVAFVEDHVRVDDPPLVTERGLAARETVGPTVTVADALCVPPAPVQERLKVLVLVSPPVDALPEVGRVPDHAPEAVQDVALVEDQVSVDDPPLATDVGFAVIDTVGTGGGGGVPVTLTCAEVLALPPGPLQVSEKLLLVPSAPVDWLPEVALVPDHAPEAAQDEALVEDQLSMDDPPLATDVGFAARDTDGPDGFVELVSPPPPQAASTNAGTSSSSLARKKISPHFL